MLCTGHTHHLVFPSRAAQWAGIRSTLGRQCERWMDRVFMGPVHSMHLSATSTPNSTTLSLSLFFFYVYFTCMDILSAYHICLPEEAINAHGTEIIDVCEPSWGCWKLNLYLLQVLTPEPLLQPLQHSHKEASILANKAGNRTRK